MPPGALRTAIAALALGCAPLAVGQDVSATPGSPAMIRYEVTLPEVQAHRVHVRLSVLVPEGGECRLALPVWTPGSYLVREFARHVLDLGAVDDAGRPLAVRKLEKNTWSVTLGAARVAHVDYVLYANERSVRTNHADADHAFLSPAATFLRVVGREHSPHRVTVDAPAGWEVFTGLKRDGAGWTAADYDELVDCPIEIGPHRVLGFERAGVPYRIVLAGRGALDETRLAADVEKIVAEVESIFGLVPYDDYTFIVPLQDTGGGGLEHRNSSVCVAPRWGLSVKKDYRRFLSLVAHELFHAWNVKRFRPEALGPFDWDRENYTRDLWVAEGITSYYDDLVTLRAGFADKVGEYLDARAQAFRSIDELPGARRTSLAAASFDAWIKFYRPDENSRNSTVSYYEKGALVALMLDLRLRRLTHGERALSDVLRLGWRRFVQAGRGYPEGALAALASEVAGADLSEFFAAHVDGTAPLQPDADLAWVGLRLARLPAKTTRDLARDEEGFALEPDLGILTEDSGGLCRVTAVLEDGAAFAAGLNVDDLLLAVDGMRVTHATLADRLDRTRGEPIELSFYRGQSLRTLRLRPALRRLADWKLVPLEDAGEAQRAAFKDWCGWDFPAAPTAPGADGEEEPAAG